MLMGISISPFTLAELEATDEVVKAAYNVLHSRKETLQRYLMLEQGGCFVAKVEGVVVGFGGAMDYEAFAYIGLMSVHPAVQKRGVGGLLLEALLAWLDGRGCSSVLLDATPVWARLYERSGFVEDDKTVVLRQMERVPIPHSLSEPVSLLVEEELPALVAVDAPGFGAERGAVLASYWADNPQRAFVVRDVHGTAGGGQAVEHARRRGRLPLPGPRMAAPHRRPDRGIARQFDRNRRAARRRDAARRPLPRRQRRPDALARLRSGRAVQRQFLHGLHVFHFRIVRQRQSGAQAAGKVGHGVNE